MKGRKGPVVAKSEVGEQEITLAQLPERQNEGKEECHVKMRQSWGSGRTRVGRS
jgi:hypothetical protein